MKIIILGPAHPYRGGIAAFSERLAHELQAEGHDVGLVTFTVQYPSFLFPGKTQFSADPAPTDLHIERALHSMNPFNWLCLGRRLARRRADVLIVPYWLPQMAPGLGTVARLVRRNGRTRVVGVLHNLVPHEPRPGDRLLSRYFVGSMDGAVALSRSVKDDVARFDAALPCVFSPHPLYDNFGLPVGREEACARLGLDAADCHLLSFGLIRDYKGLDWLLDAFADPRLRGRRVKLIVAGEFYADGEKYHAQARRLGIDGDVVWHTEFVPDSEVRLFFAAADLVVQPYKTATQSGVTQIAYHFHRPMLVTRVGGLAEIVPDGKVGYAVEPRVPAIADALVDFVGRRPDFTAGILDEKKKYAWSEMTQAILGVARGEA